MPKSNVAKARMQYVDVKPGQIICVFSEDQIEALRDAVADMIVVLREERAKFPEKTETQEDLDTYAALSSRLYKYAKRIRQRNRQRLAE